MKTIAPRARAFPQLLCLKAAENASGILTATRGRLRRLFCLERGWLVYAASNLVEEQFVELLVRQGMLEPAARAAVVEESASTGKKPSEIFLAAGTPSMEVLRRAMEGLVQELLTSCLEWPDGEIHFEDGLAKLDGEVTVRRPVLPLVLRHARRYPAAADALRVRIGPPDLRPIVADNAAQVYGAAELDALASYLLASCDGTRDLADLIGGSSAEEEPTLRALYGLLLAGILEPADPKRRVRSGYAVREAPLSRNECLARLKSASAGDHYGVLGLERLAPPDQVRESYYALARRYHPDRFRSGGLQDLLDRFESYFTQVTEAYNTLSEPERRREYDESLMTGTGSDGPRQSEAAEIAKQNYLRGRALAHQRKWTDAATFLENAARAETGNAEYNLEAGLLLARNPRRRADAERFLLRAAEIAPASVASYLALGKMYSRAAHPDAAARMFREVLRWEGDHIEAGTLLAALGPVPEEPPRKGPLRPIFES